MTPTEWANMSEDNRLAVMQEAVFDSVNEVVCKSDACDCGCETEPDGHCPHGCASVLLVAGVI